MLVEFSVENYRSFQEKQTFSMVASEDEAMLESNTFPMPNTDKLRLLKSTVLYGANASGKSNLLRGIQVLRNIVVKSASRMQTGDKFPVEPFRLSSKSEKQPTSFEIIFICQNVRYEYGLSLTKERVYEEWLIAHPNESSQKWFSRKYSPDNPKLQDDEEYEWSFGRGLKGEKKRIQKLVRDNSLFLSHAAQNNHPQLTGIFQWFQQKMNMLNPSSVTKELTLHIFEENSNFRRKVVNFIRKADIDIFDIYIKSNPIPDNFKFLFKQFVQEIEQKDGDDSISDFIDEMQRFDIITIHEMNDSDNKIEFEMSDESGGTQRLFEIAGVWLYVLQSGELLVIDELDTSLHPLLSQALVKMFHDPDINKNNAQLIFTTHDTTLLDEDIFRSDQIWLTQKERSMNTNIYSLLEFNINEDESLQKGYQLGRYGAIPLINKLNV